MTYRIDGCGFSMVDLMGETPVSVTLELVLVVNKDDPLFDAIFALTQIDSQAGLVDVVKALLLRKEDD